MKTMMVFSLFTDTQACVEETLINVQEDNVQIESSDGQILGR